MRLISYYMPTKIAASYTYLDTIQPIYYCTGGRVTSLSSIKECRRCMRVCHGAS